MDPDEVDSTLGQRREMGHAAAAFGLEARLCERQPAIVERHPVAHPP
jgi:hypothetical protein